MNERRCPGLPADWLNGWLAAIGATTLVDGLRLRWSDDPVPVAVLCSPNDADIADLLAASLPGREDIDQLPIARQLAGFSAIDLNPTFEQFAERAAPARAHPDGWTLSSFYSDVLMAKGGPTVEKGPFLPGMPGKANTLHDRLIKLVDALPNCDVARTLEGVGARHQQYGLGFDLSRLGSLADKTNHWVDPVIELLAFNGLSLFPSRGDGGTRLLQRGWRGARTSSDSFHWSAWKPALDAAGIDAFLDRYWTDAGQGDRLGATMSWAAVPYVGLGSNDPTRGLGSAPHTDGRTRRGT